MIEPYSIQQVRERMDIVEVVSEYLTLKREGVELVSKCPFHKENTGSFKVSKSKQIYKCFGCGESGDAIRFVEKIRNTTFIEAIKMLATKYFINLEEVKPEKEYTRPKYVPKSLPKPALTALEKRGITKETAEKFKISYQKEWMPQPQAEIDVTCFNYFRDSELVNIKYRGDNKEFKLHKGSELIFYNLDSITGKDYVIITEGEIDCMTVSQCGLTQVISVPNGAAKGKQQLKYLDNCISYFEKIQQIVLFVDNDEPGKMLQEELARRLGKERCLTVIYPDGCKDANDVLLQHGKDIILEMIKNAQEYPIEGILTMEDLEHDVDTYYRDGYPKGTAMGIEGLDEHITFMNGQITTITGIPGSGKSEFTDNIMCHATKNHAWVWGVCSFENQPAALHVTKLMEKIVGKSFAFRADPNSRINTQEFDYSKIVVKNYFNFININQVDVTLDGILSKAKELVERKGINALLIDPWNYIEHKISGNQTETQYISECLTKIKGFALKYNIHIIIIAHPTKLKKEGKLYEVPTMYSISGSAHFFNKTDNGISIWRNFDTKEVEIHVQKVRYSWLGKLGAITYIYNTELRKYEYLNK
jgi:twinkle protein